MSTAVKLNRMRRESFLIGRYGIRSVPVSGREWCYCENINCTVGHNTSGKWSVCRATVTPGDMDGTPERPWMLFLGVVCVGCAVSMGDTAPTYVSAPYGTLDFIRQAAGYGL